MNEKEDHRTETEVENEIKAYWEAPSQTLDTLSNRALARLLGIHRKKYRQPYEEVFATGPVDWSALAE